MSPIYCYCFLVTQKRLHGFFSWPHQKFSVWGWGEMNLLLSRLDRSPRAQVLVLLFTCSFQIIHIALLRRVLQALKGCYVKEWISLMKNKDLSQPHLSCALIEKRSLPCNRSRPEPQDGAVVTAKVLLKPETRVPIRESSAGGKHSPGLCGALWRGMLAALHPGSVLKRWCLFLF